MPRRFTLLWIAACALGELAGFSAAVFTGWYFDIYEEAPTFTGKQGKLLSAMLAGALEGGFLAAFQWAVLRKKYRHLPFHSWFIATVTVAISGWFLGMVYPVFFAGGPPGETAFTPSTALVLAMAAAMGLILGTVFGFGQWLVLRHYANRSRRWITGNALGWALGMTVIFAATSIPGAGTPEPLLWFIYITAGLMAGLSVGIVTGLFIKQINPG